MRKLATIRKISKLIPIDGADFIELALVDGWQCIVKKGEFKVGDLGVYFEIDSMLPIDKKYSFLGKTTNDNTAEGYRIRTMKMRKELSQGLMLPLSILPPRGNMIRVDEDVTKDLGVWLYEPLMKQGSARSHSQQVGLFPSFLKKTDQERIQNKMHYFDTYKDMDWEVTTKLDGSSMTVWNNSKAGHLAAGKYAQDWRNRLARFIELIKKYVVKPKTFGVCSRNINLKEVEGNAFWDIVNKSNLRQLLKGHNVAVQGELIGPKIQNNHEKVQRNEFYIFDILDIDKQEYMLPHERTLFLQKIDPLSTLKHVPKHGVHKVFTNRPTLKDLQAYSTGEGMNGGIREGYVFKSATDRNLSFKCISNKYLLRYEE